MQTDNPFLHDLSKLASSAAGTLSGVRREIEEAVKARVERMAADMDLVPREEHEVLKSQVEQLTAKVEALEAQLAKPKKAAPKKKAAAPRKAPKKA